MSDCDSEQSNDCSGGPRSKSNLMIDGPDPVLSGIINHSVRKGLTDRQRLLEGREACGQWMVSPWTWLKQSSTARYWSLECGLILIDSTGNETPKIECPANHATVCEHIPLYGLNANVQPSRSLVECRLSSQYCPTVGRNAHMNPWIDMGDVIGREFPHWPNTEFLVLRHCQELKLWPVSLLVISTSVGIKTVLTCI